MPDNDNNPFEPPESPAQQDRRVGRMIRENANKRMDATREVTITPQKRRLNITCSKELWEDEKARVAWIHTCVVQDCNSIGYAVVPSSEISAIRSAVDSDGFKVAVFFRCFPCESGKMVLQGEISTTFEDSSDLRDTAKSEDLH
jgi:hypothetical protein